MSVDTRPHLLKPAKAQSRSTSTGSRSAEWLFAAFGACTLAAPVAAINKVFFALLFAWTLWDLLRSTGRNSFPSFAPAIIIGVFAYGFALAFVNTVDMAITVQFMMATLVLLLIYFVAEHRIDLDRLAILGSFLLLLCTVLFWGTLLLPDVPFASTLLQLFVTYNMSSASDRQFFDEGVTSTVQLGTAPFLFVGFCVIGMRLITPARHRWDALGLLLIGVGIVASGQRALIGITLIYAAYLWLIAVKPSRRWLVICAIVAVSATVWLAVLSQSQVFSTEEESNSVKIGHLISYWDDLSVWSGLFGRGLASFYYSSGSHAMKAYTELTPIDLCRYFGIPLTLLAYAQLLVPLRGLQRLQHRRWGYTLAMLLFTLLSATNPVMFNSYGLLVVLWYWNALNRSQLAPGAEGGS